MFKRVMLFLITNLAIVFVLGIVLNLLGVGRIPDEQGLGLDLTNLIVFAAVFGMPEVAIYEAPDVNAFATGMRRNNALVAVSSGLLRSMNRDEAEAVLAHEISHIANGDMVTLALIQGVVNTFVIFASRVVGHLVDRVVFRTERGHGPAFYITSIAAQLVFGIIASIMPEQTIPIGNA